MFLSHWRDALFVDYHDLSRHNVFSSAAYFVTGLGHQWVIVFFVMSGYLVGGSVLRAVESGRWSWRGYLLARLTRLYCVLLPALLLGGAADWAGMHMSGTEAVYSGHSGMHELIVDVHSTLTLPALAANSLFLQTIALPGMAGHRVPTFGTNGPLWSLANEFWYYIAFPMLVLALARRSLWYRRVGYGLALIALGWFIGPSIALAGISWLMGVLIPYLPPFPASRPWTRGLVIGCALALLGTGLAAAKNYHFGLIMDLALGLAVTFLIWVTLHCATAPMPTAYVRLANRSARSSYTLYLVHLPMLIFLKASLGLPRGFPSWHVYLINGVILVVVLAYAQLVYELFEKNTDRIRNWLRPYLMGAKAA